MYIELETLTILFVVLLMLIGALAWELRRCEKKSKVLEIENTKLQSFDKENVYLRNENSELQELALSDRLTGLHNRRFFDQQLDHEVAYAHRMNESLSMCLIDIDRFKFINDTYGHVDGDEILRQLAKVFTRVKREHDSIARYGGEEFAFILPGTNSKGAIVLMERLKEEISSYPFRISSIKEPIQIKVSIGIAEQTAVHKSEAPNNFIRRVDNALYEAKKTRDTIVVEGA